MNGHMTETIGFVLLFLVMINGWMYLQQPGMIFYPERTLSATPEDWGLEYEDVSFSSEDGLRLHSWYIPHPGSGRIRPLSQTAGPNMNMPVLG